MIAFIDNPDPSSPLLVAARVVELRAPANDTAADEMIGERTVADMNLRAMWSDIFNLHDSPRGAA